MKLEDFNFYKNLNDADKEYLKSVIKPIKVPKDSILFFQGDLCEDILLLSCGNLKLYMHSKSRDTITLYHLTDGEQCIVNTSSVISSSPAIATAETVTDIEGWLLPQKYAKELMLRSESYRDFIFSLFTIKLSALAEIIEDIKFNKLEDRVLNKLKQKTKKILTITHEDLAEELGNSRVAVSRVLKLLETRGKVKLHRGKIEIL